MPSFLIPAIVLLGRQTSLVANELIYSAAGELERHLTYEHMF